MSLKRLYHLTHQRMKKAATTIIPRSFGRTVTLCTFDQCLHCDMDSFKLFWLPLPFVDSGNDQFSWLYTSRENLTFLPPNSKGAGQNTHLRSLIIAFIFRYLLTCETARPKNAAFRQGLHWINLISRAMIRLQKLCRLIYASACNKAFSCDSNQIHYEVSGLI